MNKRKCSNRMLIPMIGIVATSVVLLLSLYWIVLKVFAANAEPIDQTLSVSSTTSTTTFETTETTQTTIKATTEKATTSNSTITEVTTTVSTTTIELTDISEEVTSEIEFDEIEEEYVVYCQESQENILTRDLGLIQGPSGTETWYNLNMSGVIDIMYESGYKYEYWIRDDGVKMFGQYIMCAADLELHPRGTLVETSLGTGIVCDTGTFTYEDPYRIDIAVTW